MLGAGSPSAFFASQSRVCPGLEQDLLQVGTADERRRSERPDTRDVARGQRVRVGPALEQEADGLLAAAEDREVKRQ